jgi:hypothetical protein
MGCAVFHRRRRTGRKSLEKNLKKSSNLNTFDNKQPQKKHCGKINHGISKIVACIEVQNTSVDRGWGEGSGSPAEEEEPRATVDAASTDATRVHDPFIPALISLPSFETTRTRRTTVPFGAPTFHWAKPEVPIRISTTLRYGALAVSGYGGRFYIKKPGLA